MLGEISQKSKKKEEKYSVNEMKKRNEIEKTPKEMLN